ncbi:aromatic acid/H+ symport family MFS transporter [Paraburkholderia panacisoli]|uniref:Aromatic acid/H+ symport family MFS transporter n=1 Tax=Paraburkholderia panacisoli TaxID=2603818 RepID=A0A5B0G745_9BURK|nr:aromatic acid/H+ symport family MFS transporter [Paraburkholderia panacisoli]KAA0998515.1 aromatic acid/H+ symport family MFS transporter [Paraburkholderia panacisoli]
MSATQSISVRAFINERKMSGFQIRTLVLCFLILVLDGYDTVVVGFIAPALKAHFGATPVQFSPVFGAGFLGLAIGSFLFGPIADRFGRKTTLICAVLLFGLFSILSSRAISIEALITLRFMTGLGLGGAMPNAYTLAAEYSPDRMRSTLIAPLGCGISAGGVLGGLVASHMIGHYGWQSMLILGGILPVLLTVLLVAWLPESASFLVARSRQADAQAIVQRIQPQTPLGDLRLTLDEEPARGFPVSHLLRPGLRGGTLLLWVTGFMALLAVYFLGNWLTMLIQESGVPFARASLMTALYLTGNGLGAIFLGFLMDRMNPQYVVAGAFLCAAICLASFGHLTAVPALALVALFLTGVGTGGAMTGTSILSTGFYQTATRATGVAWTLGMGRVGSIVGSMIGGVMLSAQLAPTVMFAVVSVPITVAAVSVYGLAFYRRRYQTPVTTVLSTR